ncbi:2-oxoglutarate dehydrogenase E2 component [Breznakibacter xylanolyticus]|uniref:Dihydrolipoyllysine-residue succinyltransferase n=1 Tax=Breznakibacter xylanolyticus TaxID=990 RepID=A0A2W7NIU8_9BACT|nr:2-oxoglutarate dehydrogenase complex dihydrolipoyllysine-residue succinyltransferase [Breznakibacter xylanolyticus]PZX20325.1 2-oxoglutarate dehydrogenase E2 component [Breznakibacter xylanolyticus]
MLIDIKIPTPGESITEVEITNWLVNDGDLVIKNQELAEVESDKATLALTATESGKIHIMLPAGSSAKVNATACTIDTDFAPQAITAVPASPHPSKATDNTDGQAAPISHDENSGQVKISPVAQQMMEAHHLSIDDVLNGLRRLGARDVEAVIHQNSNITGASVPAESRESTRQKMSPLRKKLSQRLVSVKNETAMLTTFNEANMSAVMSLRHQYNQPFQEKHGVKLGLMSFFIKAVTLALTEFPAVNSMIDGDDIITAHYADISVAVQTPKGLMVPVIRNAGQLSLAQIEHTLKELAEKARAGKLSIDEMSGGTFTITNGGVFGSMLSTPLINPPQSAILGMHAINDRPVAIDGKVEIRPMMYIALSYDHRLIDGKDSVGFLKRVKELVENPIQLMTQGKNPEQLLLDLM